MVDNTKVRRPNTLYQECKFAENEERVKDEDGYDVGAGETLLELFGEVAPSFSSM